MDLKRSYFVTISNKMVKLTNNRTGQDRIFAIKINFWRTKIKIIDLESGYHYSIQQFDRRNIFGRGESRYIVTGNGLILELRIGKRLKSSKFLERFKEEFYDSSNDAYLAYLDRTHYLVKRGEYEIARIARIEEYDESLRHIFFPKNEIIFKLINIDDEFDVLTLMFYCLSIRLLKLSNN